MSEKVAVVIPIYKNKLNDFEKISLNQVQKVLGNYPIIFFAPQGKKFSYIPKNSQVIYFPAKNFQSVASYSNFLLTSDFYKKFLDYEFILLYQLDAFVISDKLEYFCSLNYDYIGAFWTFMYSGKFNFEGKNYRPRVGNGGFCLRKPAACYRLLKKHRNWFEKIFKGWGEDFVFSVCGKIEPENFKVAPTKIANKFSVEMTPDRVLKKNRGEFFFGCHNWQRYSAEFWFETLKKFGIEITNLKNQMRSEDLDDLQKWLTQIANFRLQKKIMRGENLSKYLEKNFYSAIFLQSHQVSEIFLQKILSENKITYEKIFTFAENDFGNLIQEFINSEKNFLIVTPSIFFDENLIKEFQKNNLKLKSNVEFFHFSHLKYCEKIFHKLGR